MYNLLLNQNAEADVYGIYLQQWQQYNEIYLKKGEIEFNEKTNKKWKKCDKSDARELWKRID